MFWVWIRYYSKLLDVNDFFWLLQLKEMKFYFENSSKIAKKRPKRKFFAPCVARNPFWFLKKGKILFFFFFVFRGKIKFQSKLVSVTVFFFFSSGKPKTRLSDGIFSEIFFACGGLTKFEKTCLNDRILPKIFFFKLLFEISFFPDFTHFGKFLSATVIFTNQQYLYDMVLCV